MLCKIYLQIKFLASLKTILGKDQLIYNIDTNNFTLENLIDELIKEFGQTIENLLMNKETKNINPEILIFIDNKEIQTLQKLKTPLKDGNHITFLSSIHGGFIPKTQNFY